VIPQRRLIKNERGINMDTTLIGEPGDRGERVGAARGGARPSSLVEQFWPRRRPMSDGLCPCCNKHALNLRGHPDRPWDGEHACGWVLLVSARSANKPKEGERPEMPEGFMTLS